jgi:small subunit ribosomal protein S5
VADENQSQASAGTGAASGSPGGGAAAASTSSPAGPASASYGGGGEGGHRGGGFGGGGGGRGRGGFGGGRGRPRGPRQDQQAPKDGDIMEKVVYINRSAKVVKGGRRFSFSALVVVGDRKGKVGVGLGKAGEVADAIRKGGEFARSNMSGVSLNGVTLPHEVFFEYCGAQILLRPASPGTGIIAGKTVRAVLESAGVKDVLTKSLGSKNAANVVKATLGALKKLRLREEIYKARGIAIKEKKEAGPAAAAAGEQAAVTA